MKVITQMKFERRRLQSSVILTTLMLSTVIVAHGCASQAHEFRPNASINMDSSTSGAAYYPLQNENQTIGDATVWFEDVTEIRGNNNKLIQIGLRIRNQSAQSIGIDMSNAGIEIETVDGGLLFEKVKSYSGSTTILTKETGRLYLSFELPDTISVDEIGAVDFNWTVESGTSRINKTTSFFRKNYQTHFSSYFFDPVWSSRYDWGCPANIIPSPHDPC